MDAADPAKADRKGGGVKRILELNPGERGELFQAGSQELGFSPVVVEKDFWVCFVLEGLFSLPGARENLVFKGGTSLSKAWGAIRRFSEDVDISISREWLGFGGEKDPVAAPSKSQRKKWMEALTVASGVKVQGELAAELRARFAERLPKEDWSVDVDPTEAQTLLFRYPVALKDPAEAAYIRREVKIECGARADFWPLEERSISPYVADAFPDRLPDMRVNVSALSIRRTFWEKATILHVEALRKLEKPTRSRYSRHYADLAVLADHESCVGALEDNELRQRVVEHKEIFFPESGNPYDTAHPGAFRLIPPPERLSDLATDYRDMREMYFDEPPSWDTVVARLRKLEDELNSNIGPK
jgi:hypothetical protein